MATELESILVRLVGDASNYQKMLKDSVSSTEQAASKIASLGASMTKAFTLPAAVVGGVGVKAFADFNQAITEAYAKMEEADRTPEMRERIEKFIKTLATSGEVAFSPTELAKGMEEMASAGLTAEQALKSMAFTAKFAQAGAFDVGEGIKSLTGALAGFDILSSNTSPDVYAREMKLFGDVISRVANQTKTGVKEAAEAMSGDAANAAKAYGASVEELGSILGVMAGKNIQASEASNMAGRAFRLLTASAIDPKHQQAWKKLGINIINARGEFLPFSEAMDRLNDKLKDLSPADYAKALQLLGFESLEQKAITPFIRMGSELRRQQKEYMKTGTVAEMAKIQMESFANKMKVVRSNLQVVAIEIGQRLAPWLVRLGEFLVRVSGYWRQMSDQSKEMAIAFTAVVAAAGPLLALIGLIAPLIGTGAGYVKSLIGLFRFLIPIIGSLGSLFTIELLPIIAIVVGIVAAVAAWVDSMGGLDNAWDSLKSGALEAWEYVREQFDAFMEWGRPIFQAMGSLAKAVFAEIKQIASDAVEAITSSFKVLAAAAAYAWEQISGDAVPNWDQIRDAIVTALLFAEFSLTHFGDVAKAAWAYVRYDFIRFINELAFFFTTQFPAYAGWWGRQWLAMMTLIPRLAQAAFENIASNIVDLISNLDDLISGDKSFSDLWKGLGDSLKKELEDTLVDLPDVPRRVEGTLEKQLREEWESQKDALAQTFEQFKAAKLAEFGAGGGGGGEAGPSPEVPPGAADEAKKKYKALGDDLGKETNKGFKENLKFDAALSDSAEAISRIQAYRDMFAELGRGDKDGGGKGGFGRGGRGRTNPTGGIPGESRGAAGGLAGGKVEGLLTAIRDTLIVMKNCSCDKGAPVTAELKKADL
jgi:TP901 family phage tail tape measure protein